ncbi:DUF3800 domain-containing protein [Paramicrobacterium agarici]|uniref:DUF3800 domain-containing protein n=1 Tax=Paramicrobacterium agarici TaxID=630514 RepID=UPI001154286C|nr:DUF3800 domain-containing protein [Microbacterium agarici]TQO23772.1 uncharacterized protein DUF3800 [Microbacterium agarici]
MLFAFLDESYTADRYYICGLIVDEKHIGDVAKALAEAREYARGFGVVAHNIEYHAHEIMSGRGGWSPIHGKVRSAIAIYKDALQRVANLPVKMIIRGVDVARLNARYRYPYPPHKIVLQHALEEINKYAALTGDVVTVIADEVQDQATHVMQASNYQVHGTGEYKSSKLVQIQMPIVFGSSAESPGVQCADLLVYLYRRLDAHTEQHARTRRAVEGLWETVRPIRHTVWRWDP